MVRAVESDCLTFDRPLYLIRCPVQLLTKSTSCPTSCRILLLLIRRRRPSAQGLRAYPHPQNCLPASAHWARANFVRNCKVRTHHLSRLSRLARLLAGNVLASYTQSGDRMKGSAKEEI